MPFRNLLAFLWLLFVTPGVALAWGAPGHQQVGALADQLIVGTLAERKVREILNGQSLSAVAVWADCAKRVRSTDDQTLTYQDDGKQPECRPFSGPNEVLRFESFARRNWKQCGTARSGEGCHHQYHYTDIAIAHSQYDSHFVGANDHDIVHAESAALAFLRGRKPAAPFGFADEREALMLLVHYIGDTHQPLHIEALYLDDQGQAVNPDVAGLRLENETAGGNFLILADGSSLHHEWDSIPDGFRVGGKDSAAMLSAAQAVASTPGDIETWPQAWASDTIQSGTQVFAGLRFALRHESVSAESRLRRWDVSGLDTAYQQREQSLKFTQLAKAGARLAQMLEAIWPQAATDSARKSG